MTKAELIELAQKTAMAAALDPAVVCAIVEQESGWSPWALRFEPAFFARYVAPIADKEKLSMTEANARAYSWGLMQVMGQVAREHGFAAQSLAELCDPPSGLETGCRVFAKKVAAAGGDLARGLQLWNGGSNEAYATQVLARVGSYRP